MAGGLIQLVAYGAQDVYLTSNAQITFFKIIHRRHTNFAMESIESFFNGQVNFGKKGISTVSRNGDLITQAILHVGLPEVKFTGTVFEKFGHVKFAWVKNIGHAIVEETEFDIGGAPIDKQYGDWLHMWHEVSSDQGKYDGMAKMLGNVPELTEVSSLSWTNSDNNVLKPAYNLYIPLQFYFCRNNGLALPLIALQYHEVKISAKFRELNQCYIASDAFKSDPSSKLEITNSSLFLNYIFLDTEERRRYSQVTHEYLIEQLQSTDDNISNGGAKVKLNFNHPVKAIYWATKLGNYQGGRFMVYDHADWERARKNAAKLLLLAQFDLSVFGHLNEYPADTDDMTYTGEGNQTYQFVDPANPDNEPTFVFNDYETSQHFDGSVFIGRLANNVALMKHKKSEDLRNKVNGILRIFTDKENSNMVYLQVEKITQNDLTIADLSIPVDKYEVDNRNKFISQYDLTVWQHDNYGLYIDGTVNPVSEVELQLNGQSRQSKRDGFWYDTVVPFMHHTRAPQDGLNVFSFAINPEEHQPSCTCNFSRIDSPQLNLAFKKLNGAFNESDNRVVVFAVNYNILRIMSGMGGLAYSN